MERLSVWNHNYFVTSLAVRESTVVVGDAISSVTLLNVQDSELKTVARDYGPLWPVAVEMTAGRGVVGADVRFLVYDLSSTLMVGVKCDCNLFTFSIGRSGPRATLERNGSYHLGEVVNRFLPGMCCLVQGQALR